MAWSRRYQRTWLQQVRTSCPASRPATTRCLTPTWHPRNARHSLGLMTLTGPLPWPIPLCITGVGWSPWPQWRPTAAIPSTSLRSLYIRLTHASSHKTICNNKRRVYELTVNLDEKTIRQKKITYLSQWSAYEFLYKLFIQIFLWISLPPLRSYNMDKRQPQHYQMIWGISALWVPSIIITDAKNLNVFLHYYVFYILLKTIMQ